MYAENAHMRHQQGRMEMKRKYWQEENLVLVRSDAGDGGWSLHAPWATDEQIADGSEPPLMSGPADWVESRGSEVEWNRPNSLDYQQAMNVLSARDKCK